MAFKLIRKTDQTALVEKGILAKDFFTRLRGLMGKTSFSAGEGMLFPRCNSIHMWMMKISIDVVFLKKQNQEYQILALYPALKPWKALPVACFRADDTLELPSGTIARLGLEKGQVLCIA